MAVNPDYSLQRRKSQIEAAQTLIKYELEEKSISISTADGFYSIRVKMPPDTMEIIPRIERRAREVGDFVKAYFIQQPEELHKLGYPLTVAMVNSTGTALAFNINYVAKGVGGIQNPID